MEMIEFTITSGTEYHNRADFESAYFPCLDFASYYSLCERLHAAGKLIYRQWSFVPPNGLTGVYLFTDQDAVDEFWDDPIQQWDDYHTKIAEAGFTMTHQQSRV